MSSMYFSYYLPLEKTVALHLLVNKLESSSSKDVSFYVLFNLVETGKVVL